MSLTRFPFVAFVVLSGALVVGCSSAESPGTGSGATSGTGGAGGVGGAGGMGGSGGAAGASSSSTGAGGAPQCDDYTNVPETNCNLIAQDCGLGDACRPNATGTATVCVPGAGIKGPGATCNETNECAVGNFCVFNRCAPVCCKSQAQPFCGSAPCSVRIQFGAAEMWTCNFSETCQLFADDCPANYECHFDKNQEVATCATNSGAHSQEGEGCMFVNDCGSNMICAGSPGLCRYSCSNADWQMLTPGKGGCPAGETCQIQTATVGVCAP